ncbi:MAG: DoxX family protein [Bdellovibrionota bacterium]
MTLRISSDAADLIFRALFCLIFVGLGGEHLFSDALIQHLMPEWMPLKRVVSIGCGVWLVGWGTLILMGWHLRWAAIGLGYFLIIVTAAVHIPGVLYRAPTIPESQYWMWEILQRSNLVKNLCLLGVCFHLLHHKVGKYSLEAYLDAKKNS